MFEEDVDAEQSFDDIPESDTGTYLSQDELGRSMRSFCCCSSCCPVASIDRSCYESTHLHVHRYGSPYTKPHSRAQYSTSQHISHQTIQTAHKFFHSCSCSRTFSITILRSHSICKDTLKYIYIYASDKRILNVQAAIRLTLCIYTHIYTIS